MKLEILDSRDEINEAKCYLVSALLADYVEHIPPDYQDYAVQRGIVSNSYLDRLVNTVGKKQHIPSIVIISDDVTVDGKTLLLGEFKILDGLQRTHRLKVILNTIDYLIKANDPELADNPKSFCRKNMREIRGLGANTKLVLTLLDFGAHSLKTPREFFQNNKIWLEVWVGLSSSDQIAKMLTLNAGHKSVNVKHQLELLFLDELIDLEEIAGDKLNFIREKDISATQYSKKRKSGEFHFAHVMSGLIALSAGKLVQTNSDFIGNIQSDNVKDIELIENFNIELVTKFIDFLSALDYTIEKTYGGHQTKWLGREVVMVGLFGALGAYSKKNDMTPHDVLNDLIQDINNFVQTMHIDLFEKPRNRLELNKVNIGNVNKKAVFKAVSDYLETRSIQSWAQYFGVDE